MTQLTQVTKKSKLVILSSELLIVVFVEKHCFYFLHIYKNIAIFHSFSEHRLGQYKMGRAVTRAEMEIRTHEAPRETSRP